LAKVSEITAPYFSHDMYPQKDKSIVMLMDELGYEGYGLYWRIVEFMHQNELCVGEERLIAGKDYVEKVKSILNDFDLFRIEDNRYISDRILRNLAEQKEKMESKSKAAKARWGLSSLKKIYIEIFGKAPVLSDEEIETYLKLTDKIEDFKTKLPDILFTVKKLKFENNPNFDPSINWLLANKNLPKLLNGEFGPLLSWEKHKKELEQKKKSAEQKEQSELQQEQENQKLIAQIDSICNKIDAIEFIVNRNSDLNFINPAHKSLMQKFDITKKELENYKDNN
jgi:hypothetical protein